MRCTKGSLLVLAPVCTSFSSMFLDCVFVCKTGCWSISKTCWFELTFTKMRQSKNALKPRCRFTAGRCCFIPYGHEGLDFVARGNVLATRTILMCIVASFMELNWILEQPSESNMEELPEFQFLLSIISATPLHCSIFSLVICPQMKSQYTKINWSKVHKHIWTIVPKNIRNNQLCSFNTKYDLPYICGETLRSFADDSTWAFSELRHRRGIFCIPTTKTCLWRFWTKRGTWAARINRGAQAPQLSSMLTSGGSGGTRVWKKHSKTHSTLVAVVMQNPDLYMPILLPHDIQSYPTIAIAVYILMDIPKALSRHYPREFGTFIAKLAEQHKSTHDATWCGH